MNSTEAADDYGIVSVVVVYDRTTKNYMVYKGEGPSGALLFLPKTEADKLKNPVVLEVSVSSAE